MNKVLLLALIAFAACEISEKALFQEFQLFMKRFGKKYNSLQEYMARYNIFQNNYRRIKAANKPYQGVTKFMDMTRDEFRRKYLNLNFQVSTLVKHERVKPTTTNAPDNWDWRDEGAVTKVKDQASCGSCWAFSTVGCLESQYYIKYKESMTFSEQQLVDCDTSNEGCNGGEMTWAMEWIKNNGGLMSDKDYPYVGYDDWCTQDKSKNVVTVTKWEQLDTRDAEYIKNYLYENGPCSIGINADALQWYSGGIDESDEWDCDPDGINHGVTLIGYGVSGNKKFWIGKNSWGSGWGERGFFRMLRGKNTCGIESEVERADVEKV